VDDPPLEDPLLELPELPPLGAPPPLPLPPLSPPRDTAEPVVAAPPDERCASAIVAVAENAAVIASVVMNLCLIIASGDRREPDLQP
jgi:hypothetical protein